MQLKTTYKATYAVCRLFVMIYIDIDENQLLPASANSIPGPVL
jgi:hypothetical protein